MNVTLPVGDGYSIRKVIGSAGRWVNHYYFVVCPCDGAWFPKHGPVCVYCLEPVPEYVKGVLELCKADFGASSVIAS